MPADLSVPRINEWFWDVLESSRHNLQALCRQLESLPREQLYSFQYQYWEAMEYVPPGDQDVPRLPATVQVPDKFDGEDFSDWVVSQGRAFYYELRRHPEELQACIDMYTVSEEGRGFLELRWNEEVDRDEYRGSQSPFQVGFAIYQVRFGKDIWPMIAAYGWDPDLPAPG